MKLFDKFDTILAALTKEQYKPYLDAWHGKNGNAKPFFIDYEDELMSIQTPREMEDWIDSLMNDENTREFYSLIEYWDYKNRRKFVRFSDYKDALWNFLDEEYEKRKERTKKFYSKERTDQLREVYNELFGGKYRIVLPVSAESELSRIKSSEKDHYTVLVDNLAFLMFKALKNKEEMKAIYDNWNSKNPLYRDYTSGIWESLVSGRKYRIGKMLNQVGKFIKEGKLEADDYESFEFRDLEYLYKKYSERQTKDLIVVLSRHPYDLAGMSTDRGWRSCMNLIDGEYRGFVETSILSGVLIAYICSPDDTTDIVDSTGKHHRNNKPNIQHPLGRVLIKPYYNEEYEGIEFNPPNFILKCSKAYGTFNQAIIPQIQKWIDKNWNNKIEGEVFNLPKQDIYDEEESDIIER